jgi:DNA-binding NarL/FixJ family response regulator
MPNTPNRILIIDDHRLFADGLSLILSKQENSPHVSTETDAQRVLEDSKKLENYDLILVDLEMPKVDGYAFLQSLTERKINTPTILISSTENRSDIERALQLGAKGFIPKYSPTHEMLAGIKSVLNGELYVPEHLVGTINWPTKNSKIDSSIEYEIKLSPRPVEVLNLLYAGHSNTEIATILNLSESTVKGHIALLFKKFNVKNRTGCVREAIKHRLIK